MSFAWEVKRRVKAALPPVIFLSLSGYFAWSATQGDRGLEAMTHRQDQLRLARADLTRAVAEQEMWDRRAASLRVGHLDQDALDERARAMLNLADPSEVVVMYGPGKKLF